MSPTQRTLAWCRKEGMTVAVVEKYNSFSGRRIDLFGLFDLVALDVNDEHPRVIGIQCGAAGGHAAHRDKMQANPILEQWKACWGRALICSWRKYTPVGKKRPTYTLKLEEL